MKTYAIVGINWGDEGKGRMGDLLTRDYVEYMETAVGCYVGYVSVGPEWDAYIKR